MTGPIVRHLAVLGVDAVVVVDGPGDSVVANLLAAGWVIESTTRVDGKRVRTMTPPLAEGMAS